MHIDVLIVTVTEVESDAVFQVFKEATGQMPKAKPIGAKIYLDLGVVNGASVFMVQSEMGAGGLGAAQQTVQKGIAALSPSAVIMVGIAFGLDAKKQSIGDILISQRLLLYDLQRVGADKIIPRGDRPHASAWLFNRCQNAKLFWDESKAKVRFGLILSGEKLVDNMDFRQQLLEFEPEAIGGEMEGAGLYAASQDSKVDWLLVKAICDWADGHKDQARDERQRLAARNAATYVLHVLQQAPLKLEGEDKPEGKAKPPTGQRLKFLNAFRPDPVTVRRVIEEFETGESPCVEWPASSNALLEALRTIYAHVDNYDAPSSPFVEKKPDWVHNFLIHSSDAYKNVPNMRSQIESRISYLLEELSTQETFQWREEALIYFLQLANFDLHWPLARALTAPALKPATRANLLRDPWRTISRCDHDKAMAIVMDWPLPLYRQNVMNLSGEPMNRYFYVPEQYCQNAFKTKEIGFVRCIIPQNELHLAFSDATRAISYDGKADSSKTVDEDGNDVYPHNL